MTKLAQHDPLDLARAFVTRAPVHMFLLDLEGRRIAFSASFVAIFVKSSGMSAEDLIGRHAVELRPDMKVVFDEMHERLAAGEDYAYEQDYLNSDGGVVTLRGQANYWRDDDGRPVGVLLTYQDITAERRAEAARREYEAQLQAVVDNVPAQISLVNLDTGRVELLNTKAMTEKSSLIGTTVGESIKERLTPERLTPERLAKLNRHVAQAEATGGCIESEVTLSFGPAAGRIMRVKHIIFRDGHGQRKLLWVGEDITDLKESALALERAAAEAHAANRAKSEFLANMSHEIRTPLNGVMGVAGALARTVLSPPQQEMVSIIETSAKTLETLLSDILDLARIEAGKMELKSEPFDLADSVRACVALFDAAAQAKGLDIDLLIAPEALGGYVGDAARIRQILTNLLGNAMKFTSTGSIRLCVRATRKETTSHLIFEVRDSGIGFDAETKARLFSRFEQADGSITRKFGGTGLGLAISRSLAEAMGGELDAEAEPGQGAVFTLTLELPRCESTLDLSGDEAEPATGAVPLAGLRVLVAEDHPNNRRVVELILSAADVDLTFVENGVEAVEAFRPGRFDLILMDMQMPVMDGLTAIMEIRKLEAAAGLARMPIYVLTANAMPEQVSASLAAGADGHLTKPILADVLLQRVAEAAAASKDEPLL